MRTCSLFVLAVLLATAVAADARFRWKGRVDGVDEILVQGRSVRINHVEAQPVKDQDYRFSAPLPSRDAEVRLRKLKGRGKVRLMEQPSARNGYTAVVRIEDKKGGDSKYEFELLWDDDDDDSDDGGNDSVFRWKGRVDKGVVVEIRGDEHQLKDMGGAGTQEKSVRFDDPLPKRDVAVSLKKKKGRGKIRLVQKPNLFNGFTAKVRIEDDKGGAGDYEFELRWKK